MAEPAQAMTIQSFVDAIASKANIDQAAAETAVGTILSAIQQEGDAAKVGKFFRYQVRLISPNKIQWWSDRVVA